MRFGLAMSSRGQTGQSEAIHSPDEWHSRVAGVEFIDEKTSCEPALRRRKPESATSFRRI
jgi:hypothetical protein